MTKAIMFAARHSHPELDGLEAIFSEGINPVDFAELDRQASAFFKSHTDAEYCIYVTGLTAATVAIIKAAVGYQVKLTLMHYNRDNDSYVPQRVIYPVTEEQGCNEWGVTVPTPWL